jgi:allantoin racemase
MRQLLIINPNTSASVTALLQQHAQVAGGQGVQVRTVTARFGAPYISCESGYAVAAHATLDAWAAAIQDGAPAPDAVLIGCFGDPGLFALRDVCSVPVTGLAEAAFLQAANYGPYAVVTGGARWKSMLQRLAQGLGLSGNLAGIHTVEATGAELAQNPIAAQALLAIACNEAAQLYGAKAVVLGGAGLAGMAAKVQSQVAVPVIDSVLAGTQWALQHMGQGQTHATGRFDVQWQGVSPEMTALGR